MNSPVLILGGGVTGMHVATALGELGYPSILLEKTSKLGGRVRRLSRTFPFFDDDGFNDGLEFTSQIEEEMRVHSCVDLPPGSSRSTPRTSRSTATAATRTW